MKKIKHLLLLVVCFGLFIQVNSAPIDRAIAKKAAIAYCKHKTTFFKQNLNASSVINEHTLFFSGKPTMFVFNMEEGFVITTTDDRAPAIIAYSPKGNFDVNNIPAVVTRWLNPIQEFVADLQISNPKSGVNAQWTELMTNNFSHQTTSTVKGVAPLLTSHWGQGARYNDSCPIVAGASEPCVTGCVATSMAQIMKYHEYPQFGNGSNSYSHIYFGTISASFDGVEYLWSNMTNTSNAGSRSEISKLMFHAGVSVNMNYGPDGSGAQSAYAAYALQNNFRYRPDIRSISRLDYTLLNWQRVIKDNIDAHQPVLYSATDDSTTAVGGHAWVCDGYNDNKYFHMNWGWEGASDGYYFLDTLTTSTGRFNASQSLIVNIAPLSQKFCYETRIFNEPNFTFNDGSNMSQYKNNSDCRMLIDLDSMAIKLTFTYFNTQADHDFLKIYHGTTDAIGDSLIGTYSGITPPPVINTVQGGKLYLVFTSDTTVQSEGWTGSVQGLYQGVENYTVQNNVTLYPNPATDNLWITIPEVSNTNAAISILDITGRVVYNENAVFSNAGNALINISSLKAGIYVLKVNSASKSIFSSKLIKK
jgi:hypothetical protein